MSLSRIALSVVFGASIATFALAQQNNNSNGKGSSSSASSSQSHPSSGSSSHQTVTPSRQNGSYHNGTQYNGGSSYRGYNGTNHNGYGTYHNGYGSTNYGYGNYHSYNRTYTNGTTHSTQSNGYQGTSTQARPQYTPNHTFTNVNGLGNQQARMHGPGNYNGTNAQVGNAVHHSPYTGNHNFANGYTGSSHNGQALVYNSTPYLGRRGNWREGYYRPGWHDETFFFGFYVFSPYESACVVSPWYYYGCLPPYLASNRVVILNDNCDWNDGAEYNYAAQQAPNTYGDGDLNTAISQLQNVFQNDDESAIGQIVDSSMQVGVYNDGKYMYSVNSDDFSQMMVDNVKGVQNVAFTVTDVKVQPDYAIVTARHEFSDGEDGGSTVVYQEYRLTRNGDHYAIEDFNTSKSPGGARTFF